MIALDEARETSCSCSSTRSAMFAVSISRQNNYQPLCVVGQERREGSAKAHPITIKNQKYPVSTSATGCNRESRGHSD